MWRRAIVASLLLSGVFLIRAGAQNPLDEKAIRHSVAGYEAAFNKGDMDKLMGYWAADADYVDDSGTTHKGRAAIGKLFRRSAEDLEGCTMKLSITSLRFLKDDVAIEDGLLEMKSPGGSREATRYSAVWIKKEGKWVISSARDLGSAGSAIGVADRLKPLEWLIGSWRSESARGVVDVNCRWAPGKAFAILETNAKLKDGTSHSVTQYFGWDPQEGAIRSWFFDSHGGFGHGFWEKDGMQWTGSVVGMLPDGSEGSAVMIWKKIDDKNLKWSSRQRQIGGQEVPDLDLTFTRVK